MVFPIHGTKLLSSLSPVIAANSRVTPKCELATTRLESRGPDDYVFALTPGGLITCLPSQLGMKGEQFGSFDGLAAIRCGCARRAFFCTSRFGKSGPAILRRRFARSDAFPCSACFCSEIEPAFVEFGDSLLLPF